MQHPRVDVLCALFVLSTTQAAHWETSIHWCSPLCNLCLLVNVLVLTVSCVHHLSSEPPRLDTEKLLSVDIVHYVTSVCLWTSMYWLYPVCCLSSIPPRMHVESPLCNLCLLVNVHVLTVSRALSILSTTQDAHWEAGHVHCQPLLRSPDLARCSRPFHNQPSLAYHLPRGGARGRNFQLGWTGFQHYWPGLRHRRPQPHAGLRFPGPSGEWFRLEWGHSACLPAQTYWWEAVELHHCFSSCLLHLCCILWTKAVVCVYSSTGKIEGLPGGGWDFCMGSCFSACIVQHLGEPVLQAKNKNKE